jgi:hypothetical protein
MNKRQYVSVVNTSIVRVGHFGFTIHPIRPRAFGETGSDQQNPCLTHVSRHGREPTQRYRGNGLRDRMAIDRTTFVAGVLAKTDHDSRNGETKWAFRPKQWRDSRKRSRAFASCERSPEQLDTDIVARMEESEGIGAETLALHGDLADQIAGHDYLTVEQSVTSRRGLMDMETVGAHVDAGLIRLGRYLG